MWYFSWILGLGLACAFAILNAMWFELREGHEHEPLRRTQDPLRGRADPERETDDPLDSPAVQP
ncbi:Cyd operon protein YbgT [plant metagenome]|uniref:Cyd operon protein YbgT n=1 Tax=plant metagenome TaxID=1297885 RepID=A0A484R3J6_9ZZZZ